MIHYTFFKTDYSKISSNDIKVMHHQPVKLLLNFGAFRTTLNGISNMKFILVVLLILVTSCVSTPKSSQDFNWSGNLAYDQMQYAAAKSYYEKAIELAKNSSDKEYQAIAMYGLARTNGRLCLFDQAEDLLTQSIEIRNKLSDTDNAKITQNILELGRIHIAQQNWDMAIIQYEKAIPMLNKFNIETSDPIGYSNLLTEYSQVLEHTDQNDKKQLIEAKISELRANNSDQKAGYFSQLYSSNCKN